ncbi:lysozyme [Parvularcula sp. LCG005]|uniref:lysozyme n=1 Tax=Parvularcula sp. LCG005 TaxID=3078805 RepID=UPI002942CFA2|nr:lysozyme [Parvularcula sp. LCG005]WOI54290.1 lysozyme [Parvularcula sp. LCG005]
MMKLSEPGLTFLKMREGLRLRAYQDVAGIWTIGYGHTGPDAREGNVISEFHAEVLLREDAQISADCVNELIKVPMKQHVFDALVSFTYNLGCGALKRSTLRKLINDEVPMEVAAASLQRWNKARVNGTLQPVEGLTRRRRLEAQVMTRGVYA